MRIENNNTKQIIIREVRYTDMSKKEQHEKRPILVQNNTIYTFALEDRKDQLRHPEIVENALNIAKQHDLSAERVIIMESKFTIAGSVAFMSIYQCNHEHHITSATSSIVPDSEMGLFAQLANIYVEAFEFGF